MYDLELYEKGLDSLDQIVRIFSDDIGMEFGIDKCATLVLKRGKLQNLMKFHCLMKSNERIN